MKEFEMILHYSAIGEGLYVCHEVGELVRCKDCKYFEEIMTARYRDGTTKEVQICKKHVPLKDENFYCGLGERKDEVEE